MYVIAKRPEIVAATIRQQIGTDTWLAVSARKPKYRLDGNNNTVFSFRFGSRYGLQCWIDVTYERVTDDYRIFAYRFKRNGCKQVIANYEGVYADSLAFLIRDINTEEEYS